MKNIIKLILKILIVFGLFYYLSDKGLISWTAFRMGIRNYDHFIPGIGMLVFCSLLGVIRWQTLLRAQDIRLPFLRTLQLHFIGNFFNVALPGAVSGDLVKAFYIAKESPGDRAKAFGSILLDRIVGISALVLVAVGALWIQKDSLSGTPVIAGVKTFIWVSGVCVFVFYGYLFLMKETWDPILKFLNVLEKISNKFGSLTRIYQGVLIYQRRKKSVFSALAISITIHLGAGYACLQFARALLEYTLEASQIYVVAPLGLLVTAVPLLPGGVGTGHAAFGFFFQLIGSLKGADIFSLYVLGQLMIGGVGGLVYLRFKSQNPEISARLSQTASS